MKLLQHHKLKRDLLTHSFCPELTVQYVRYGSYHVSKSLGTYSIRNSDALVLNKNFLKKGEFTPVHSSLRGLTDDSIAQ